MSILVLQGLMLLMLVAIGVLIVSSFIWFRSFDRLFHPVSTSKSRQERQPLPPTLVMLCLRGSDPFLKDTLLALSRQTERNFDLRVVIDHPQDSSVQVVKQFQKESQFDRLQIRYLEDRHQTCGLKVSALLQELSLVESSYDVIVQIDADAMPYPGWLAEMVSPLNDPQVGVTSGLRWYMPNRASWACLIRYVWGTSGTVQMHWFGMPWGGSLAFRRDLLSRTRILDLWRSSLTEDLVFDQILKQSGLRLQFVPAVMVNREETCLKDCCSFIGRQMLLVRHYHSAWWKVGGYAFLNGVATLCAILLGCSVAVGAPVKWTHLVWMAPLLYLVSYALMMWRAEQTIRRKVVEQGGAVTPIDYRYILAQPAALIVHSIASAAAMVRRTVRWRGVTYQIGRGGRVRILQDEPYSFRADQSRQTSLV